MTPTMPDPHIFGVNPEKEAAPVPFNTLYRDARKHFCYHLWQASGESHFAAALLQKEDVWFRRLVEELITKTWREVAPASGQVEPYIKADPGLIEPHEHHDFGGGKKPESHEEAALYNVYMWLYQSLWNFWDHRLEGRRAIVIRVTRTGITIKGVLPIDVAQALYQGKGNLPITHESGDLIYDDAHSRRPAFIPEESSDLPF